MSKNQENSKIKWQKMIFIFLGGGIGVLLLLFGGGIASDKESEDIADTNSVYEDADVYAAMLEKRVAEICAGVTGSDKVEVFVSLKGGYRTVYAVDSQSNATGYKNEIVMSGSGSDKRAVITAYENPEISGVAIVCEGAEMPNVKERIISLVCAALNVGANKIFVAECAA